MIAQGRANLQGANATAPTKGKVMSQMSPLTYSTSAAATAPEGKAVAEPEPGQAELTISQMSQLYAVSPRTLRFYEARGLIKPSREGNLRLYRAADRVRMEMILQGKKLGFTLTEINDLIDGKGPKDTPDLERRLQPKQIGTRSVTLNANAMKSTAPSSGSARPTTICRKARRRLTAALLLVKRTGSSRVSR